MKPRGPLMIEHRLIEKMLTLIADEARQIHRGKPVDPLFIDMAVDFIRTYADRTHHGKEEDILFRELAKRGLSAEDSRSMNELIDEHRMAREKVKGLVAANERVQAGSSAAVNDLLAAMEWLADFYPRHIRKEDKEFFPRTERYFSEKELAGMLEEFRAFDGRMIHEKYENLVKRLQGHGA